VRECLRAAVRRRMVADVPVGVLLSGGLDSSLIVALLAEEGQTGLRTFSIGFPDVGEREGDEFAYSHLVARELGPDHHQLRRAEGLAARAAALGLDDPVSRDFVAADFARSGASTALDRALRLDQQVMLVDDPVKRVDNMTMAHGLEARTPFLDHDLVELAAACPPELKLAHGGKGVLKEAARGRVPDVVVDRPKGYFPVPALVELQGAYLDLVRDALAAPAA